MEERYQIRYMRVDGMWHADLDGVDVRVQDGLTYTILHVPSGTLPLATRRAMSIDYYVDDPFLASSPPTA